MQSLRTQTFKDFDVFIRDDASGTPIQTYYFLNMLIVRMIDEGNKIVINRNDFCLGVSGNRHALVEDVDKKKYELMARLDDDVILQPDYLERLIKVIDMGYDMATGITTPFSPTFKRDPKFLKIINRIILDDNGNFVLNGDDCGIRYTDSVILPAHHFRSCAVYLTKIHEKVNYKPTKLSVNGYREEEIFSLKMLLNGFKIGCDTGAVNFHLMTPSGGERPTMNLAPFNQQILCEFVKENKDELNKLFPRDIDPLELNKENNLLR